MIVRCIALIFIDKNYETAVVGDKCLGLLEAAAEVWPQARYQRCTVHFYRNVLSVVPKARSQQVALLLKSIHAQESKDACRRKAKEVVDTLETLERFNFVFLFPVRDIPPLSQQGLDSGTPFSTIKVKML